jgi:hypothetical protein
VKGPVPFSYSLVPVRFTLSAVEPDGELLGTTRSNTSFGGRKYPPWSYAELGATTASSVRRPGVEREGRRGQEPLSTGDESDPALLYTSDTMRKRWGVRLVGGPRPSASRSSTTCR